MKRILKSAVLFSAISMFFTGCGSTSLISNLGDSSYKSIAWQVMETEEDRSQWGKAGLAEGETLPEKKIPDLYVINEEKKYQEAGDPAFQIKDGHSLDTTDMESFSIGTLLSDGTFIYGYKTKVGEAPDSGVDNRSMVHCGAKYNYKTKNLSVFHENVFLRDDTKEESFYIQICENDDDEEDCIFVYDNGIAYLYDVDGTLKFETDIETFVLTYFKGHSVVATQAHTDGQYRMYVDLVIEKNEISSPDPGDPNAGDDISEEAADEEAEKLDAEVTEQTIEVVLVYDFQEISTTIDQNNLNFDAQIEAWKEMADGKTYTEGSLPDAESDWNSVVSDTPDNWGPVFFDYLEEWSDIALAFAGVADPYIYGAPAFSWKNGEKVFTYQNDGYVCTFWPDWLSYQPSNTLSPNSDLSNTFIIKDGHYYEVFGKTGAFSSYNSTQFSRTITVETESSDGEETETETYQVTQTLTKSRSRYCSLSNEYLEGYWIASGDSTIDVIDDKALLIDGKRIYWLGRDFSDNTLVALPEDDEEDEDDEESEEVDFNDYIIDTFKREGTVYLTISNEAGINIYPLVYDETKDLYMLQLIGSHDTILNSRIASAIELVEYEPVEVEQKYLDAYEKLNEKGPSQHLSAEGSAMLDGHKLYPVTLNIQKEKLEKLEEFGYAINADIVGGTGYLATAFGYGLIYVDTASGLCINLDPGTWYGTWKCGDKFVSVGFPEGEVSYGTLDVAFSKVMEYDLDTFYSEGLDRIINSIEALNQEEPETEPAKYAPEDGDLMDNWAEWEKEHPKESEVTLIQPEDDKAPLDAWNSNDPDALTKQRESSAAAVSNYGKEESSAAEESD